MKKARDFKSALSVRVFFFRFPKNGGILLEIKETDTEYFNASRYIFIGANTGIEIWQR